MRIPSNHCPRTLGRYTRAYFCAHFGLEGARRRPAGRARAARKATRASSSSVGTAGRTVPRVRTPESRLFADIDQRSQGRRGASVGLGVRARGRPRRAAPSPCVPRSLAGPYGRPGRDPRRTNGRWSGPRHPPDPQGRALTRCRVVRGGEVMRCAGRRDRPRGAADGLAPPAPAAPDRRRAGPRRRAVPARG